MKTTIKSTVSLFLVLAIALCFAGCGAKKDPWKDATYLEDTTLGEGAKTVTVEVKAEEKTVTFTVKTDKEILGDALLDVGLLEGEESSYGLYVKKVNGIRADYDKDGRYWAFYIDGAYASTGVDTTTITEGSLYRLEYAK